MKWVAGNTSMPVPKVYCSFERKGVVYIVMECIDGEVIARNWHRRSDDSKAALLLQLRSMFNEMRAIPPPREGIVAAADLAELHDYRISPGPSHSPNKGFGPFSNSKEFHLFLRDGVKSPIDNVDVQQLITMHEEKEYASCFTHGDLSSFNVLVRDGAIVGIIDWEMAGWLPEYWEYTSAWNVNPYNEFWREEVNKFLDSYPKELGMEQLRRRCFGDL